MTYCPALCVDRTAPTLSEAVHKRLQKQSTLTNTALQVGSMGEILALFPNILHGNLYTVMSGVCALSSYIFVTLYIAVYQRC